MQVAMSAARDQLLQMLQRDSDMELIFEAADGAAEVVPGHSLILSLWSTVIRAAIDADRGRNSGKIRVPMTGTSKEDWLLAMEFLYPVIPPPAADWDNLESLLAVADKYGMSGLLQRFGTFLVKRNRESFDFNPNSKRFVWKWIIVADRYGLVDIAKQCIDEESKLHELVRSWPVEQSSKYAGHQWSAELLNHLMKTLATKAVVIRRGVPYCPHCNESDVQAEPCSETEHSCLVCYNNVIIL